jgi:hypothetical protein
LLTLPKKDKTCKNPDEKVFNEFFLSKYQNSKTLNDISFGDAKMKKAMGKGAVSDAKI